ncbi:unnamed protein product, partial [Allacma fusca]
HNLGTETVYCSESSPSNTR